MPRGRSAGSLPHMGHGAGADTDQLILEAGLSEDEITARFGAGVSADFRDAVDAEGIPRSEVMEFSATQQWAEIVSLTIGPGGAAVVLRPVLLALIEKRRDRSIRIKHGDTEIETKGCTAAQVKSLLDEVQKSSEQRAADWKRIKGEG